MTKNLDITDKSNYIRIHRVLIDKDHTGGHVYLKQIRHEKKKEGNIQITNHRKD